ncbi:hypothetical protein [Plantactinospora sp. GCM10030261]|uniref:hypothetical protein n=1 Tax=Plantactinospora sp. GCM10030261 TaxID=3273420 RepID=UPI00360D961E
MQAVGGWWNRQFNPEIDIIGADRAPVAQTVYFAGSVKWLSSPFDARDLADLTAGATKVPGFDHGRCGLVLVSLSGLSPQVDSTKVDVVWGPSEVLSAWRG